MHLFRDLLKIVSSSEILLRDRVINNAGEYRNLLKKLIV